MNIQQKRLFDGARNYALADKSDPFAYARAMTHIGNGIASVSHSGDDAAYSAEPGTETRKLPDGTEYQAVVYRNLKRP